MSTHPLIIGAGLAGLTTALSLAPMPVIVLCAGKLGEQSSSCWAQGGIAAAVGADDTPSLHAEDTINAGGGLCDPAIVKLVTEGGASVIEKLTAQGVVFDRDATGRFQLGLEGAHGHRRIVHISGDGAGAAIMQAVIATVRATPSIEIIENAIAIRLQVGDQGLEGVSVLRDGKPAFFPTNRMVLATGGAGALWRHTTNPFSSWGCGLALAARAGTQLADLEFMQFHPTAIDIGRDPMPLASEALRGEGAVLVDEKGERFMAGFKRAELEPRDVVSRAIWAHMNKGHKVYLDARASIGENFAKRFPAIHAVCMSAGIDPARAPIPVCPAAHYHMGGVAVDASGRSSVAGLWACGEVASTGLHGANRLASNSLLEAAFFGARVAEDIKGVGDQGSGVREVSIRTSNPEPQALIRDIMSAHLGVLRNGPGMENAIQQLLPLAEKSDMALAGLMIAVAAARREESRGSHTRTDFPAVAATQAKRHILTLDGILDYAQGLSAPFRWLPQEPDMPLVPLPDLMLEPLVRNALLEDLGHAGDITTTAMIAPHSRWPGMLVARQPGIVAGLDLARLAFRLLDPAVTFEIDVPDGNLAKLGTAIARVNGPARSILAAERTALNFLCHLSGIATATHVLVEAAKPHKARICCTRKTNPGLRAIEKYAVRAGGGSNHRFGLDDAILIKDNHIAAAGGIHAAVRRAREAAGHLVKIELEVDTLDQLGEAIGLPIDAVMLDNMEPAMIKKAVDLVAGRFVTEASGRVSLDTVNAIAATGVDIISVGWITHSAPILDIGLDAA